MAALPAEVRMCGRSNNVGTADDVDLPKLVLVRTGIRGIAGCGYCSVMRSVQRGRAMNCMNTRLFTRFVSPEELSQPSVTVDWHSVIALFGLFAFDLS